MPGAIGHRAIVHPALGLNNPQPRKIRQLKVSDFRP